MSRNKHISKKTRCFSRKRSKNKAKPNEFERRILKLSCYACSDNPICRHAFSMFRNVSRMNSDLCIRQRKPWTPPPQGSTQIRRRDDVESWGVYFQGLVNLDLINFLTMWIFTLCEFRPGESWTNAVYISSENVLNTKIDCSKNVLLIVVLVEYKPKWMCC